MTLSRKDLEEAVELWGIRLGTADPASWRVSVMRMADAAQAVLDGEPIEWCVPHDVSSDVCQIVRWKTPCRFETQVRVRVGP